MIDPKLKSDVSEVIRYSQNIENPMIDKLLEDWLKAKSPLMKKFFNGGVSYRSEEKITFELNDESKLTCKSIICCVGTTPNVLNIPEENECLDKISFCATCDAPFYKNKIVAVIGGGNSAMEFASSLSIYCKKVFVIHRRNSFRAEAAMINKVKSCKNVTFLMETIVESLYKNNNKKVQLNLVNKNESKLEVDGIFYAIGHRQNLIDISDVHNVNGIFYAGDCISNHKQVITACGDGCKAALDCINFLTF